jgi:hypothetical protein
MGDEIRGAEIVTFLNVSTLHLNDFHLLNIRFRPKDLWTRYRPRVQPLEFSCQAFVTSGRRRPCCERVELFFAIHMAFFFLFYWIRKLQIKLGLLRSSRLHCERCCTAECRTTLVWKVCRYDRANIKHIRKYVYAQKREILFFSIINFTFSLLLYFYYSADSTSYIRHLFAQ